MPHVGIALALGPNLNVDAGPEETRAACGSARKALSLSQQRDERAYAAALSDRYCGEGERIDSLTYAISMQELFRSFPDDPDAAALYAETLLLLRPRTVEQNAEMVAVLEMTLARWPEHVGANHYYIHAVEGSRSPERGLPSAVRLRALVPSIGHLLHMPSHIESRLGDYRAAIASNVAAVAADLAYLKANGPDPDLAWSHAHDLESLAVAAGFAGKLRQALEAAESQPGSHHSPFRSFVLLRFQRWSEVLDREAPVGGDPLVPVWHHFARTVAHAALGQLPLAESEQEKFEEAAASVPAGAYYRSNPAPAVLAVYRSVLEARLEWARGEREQALSHWSRAVDLYDRLEYHEPPPLYYPPRESLGAALFAMGRHADAERIFREDLERHPGNGRSFFGLSHALAALGRKDEAETVRHSFLEAWKDSDAELSMDVF
jgi:tetratricopeptide (TPR) repeat protein